MENGRSVASKFLRPRQEARNAEEFMESIVGTPLEKRVFAPKVLRRSTLLLGSVDSARRSFLICGACLLRQILRYFFSIRQGAWSTAKTRKEVSKE